jgi:hypothetical protein
VTKRSRLKQYLVGEIDIIKESEDDPGKDLLKTLYEAVEGLKNLELAEDICS